MNAHDSYSTKKPQRKALGASTFVRQLAEAELTRVRRARILAESRAVAAYVAEHPTAFDDDDPAEWFSPPEPPQRRLEGLVVD